MTAPDFRAVFGVGRGLPPAPADGPADPLRDQPHARCVRRALRALHAHGVRDIHVTLTDGAERTVMLLAAGNTAATILHPAVNGDVSMPYDGVQDVRAA